MVWPITAGHPLSAMLGLPTQSVNESDDTKVTGENGDDYFSFALFSFGSDENVDVGVGVFPEREEVLVGGEGVTGVVFCTLSKYTRSRHLRR
jgi:hypothetical protein